MISTIELRSIEDLSSINGGGFCGGFAIVAGTYAAGVAANLWNPVGQTATAVGAVITIGCAINEIIN